MRDDPIIESLEETGLPPWNDGRTPICPICGESCRWIYKKDGEVLGCDICIEECDAWEALNDE